jgi:F-type H+-transporting ATPase subunit b
MLADSRRSLTRFLCGLLLTGLLVLPGSGYVQADETDSATAAEVDTHGGDGHETGVPGWKTDLALWTLVTFVCFLFVLRKFAWGPLIAGLDQRELGIRTAIAEAEENRRKSEALLADYEAKLRDAEKTVAEMVAEAKRDSERTSQDIVTKAEADVDAMRLRAEKEITQAKNTALSEVFGSVNRQVALATERVLGRALSDQDQDRLIDEALQEVGR